MTDRTIIAGDSYETLRPLFRIELKDADGAAFDLTSCIVRTTFKAVADSDATDAEAVITADAEIDSSGDITAGSGLVLADIVDGEYTASAASAGVLLHFLSSTESAAVPVGTAYISDVEVSAPAASGSGKERITFLFTDTLTCVNGITNRTETPS